MISIDIPVSGAWIPIFDLSNNGGLVAGTDHLRSHEAYVQVFSGSPVISEICETQVIKPILDLILNRTYFPILGLEKKSENRSEMKTYVWIPSH